MLNGKVTIALLTVRLIKKILWYKMCYFPDPYTHIKNKIKVELDLSNHTTKFADTLELAKKADLASLKWDIDKLKTTPADLSKLTNVVVG